MRPHTIRSLRTTSIFHQNAYPSRCLSSLFLDSQLSLLSQLRRHQSTSPSTNLNRKSKAECSVNAPASTLPPPLDLPTREPGQSFFPSYAFQLGRAYASFYKAGVKAIWTNHKLCNQVKTELRTKYSSNVSKAIEEGRLDRSAFQLLYRHSYDLRRLPIFGLIIIVCGEFTPLIVLAISGIVPYTCRIPKQITADLKKLEQRRLISFRNLTSDLPEAGAGVGSLNRMQLLHISWSLGLSATFWDVLGGRLPGLPTPILRNKVAKRVSYLKKDDLLIESSGSVREMDIQEVRIALVERGVDVLGKDDATLRGLLNNWLQSRKQVSVEQLLLTRPNVWPSSPPSQSPRSITL